MEESPHRDRLLREFLELVMSWIDFGLLASAEGHRRAEISEVRRLADEQAALRRVATLVARGASPPEIFAVVTYEVGRLYDLDQAAISRYEPDGSGTVVVGATEGIRGVSIGTRWPLEDFLSSTAVYRTGRPARKERSDYDHGSGPIADRLREAGLISTVAAPILVEGNLWGVMTVSDRNERLPPDVEERVAQFTELVAAAIANVEARAEVQRLADEQSALRRVATLVAREASHAEVFAAIGEECARLFAAEHIRMVRFDGESLYVVASAGGSPKVLPVGSRQPLGGMNTASAVFRTGRPARLDDYQMVASGLIGEAVRSAGMRSAVATPIIVEGRIWGAIQLGSTRDVPLPPDTEFRLGEFTELMATAIANVQARSDLATSRARIVVAGDEERRRVVRDLHDGAQQRLVHTVVTLKHAQSAHEQGRQDAAALVGEALEHARRATAELRELVHGILPSALTLGGLDAGIQALASRMTVPVDVNVRVGRLPEAVESTAYFIVAEALTNVAKHAHARRATVTAQLDDGVLHIEVRDDGVGGARVDGHGLVGLRDRLAALDGTLLIESPDGGGTQVSASIPVPPANPASATAG
ncbi:MAG TPA: GAF domain-containing sensor histidine kinase [Solirubrobacteraceae bacterium]